MKWVVRAVRRMCDRPGEELHDLGYRRAWREDLEIRVERTIFEIGLHKNLVAWMAPDGTTLAHSEADPWPIGFFLVQLRFTEWRWPSQDHSYYDGCHCSWRVGPLQIHRSMGQWCRKCAGE